MQNTNEILSRYLLYEAGDDEASETAESYAARGCKASENSQLSEAEMKKASEHRKPMHKEASEHRKPMHKEASEIKRILRAVCKRVEVEETSKYEAMGEEATEMRDSQECILNGGVYLRHRLEKPALKNLSALLFPQRYYTSSVIGVQLAAFRRASMQEATSPTFQHQRSLLIRNLDTSFQLKMCGFALKMCGFSLAKMALTQLLLKAAIQGFVELGNNPYTSLMFYIKGKTNLWPIEVTKNI